MTGTAAAAAAMAALTASQAPVVADPVTPAGREAAAPASPAGTPGDAYYHTALPPLVVGGTPPVRDARAGRGGDGAVGVGGGTIPAAVLAAYRNAEDRQRESAPGCRLRWQLLAAIGQVESAQARGGRVDARGTTFAPIVGPRLDGRGFALIRDTDRGAYDGDAVYDRAVGPMQFIPSTWAAWGADGNGDGVADPHNVHDAALAAGRYLCAGGRDLAVPGDLDRAVLAYNRSVAYLRLVRSWYGYFLDGRWTVDTRAVDAAGGSVEGRAASPSPAPSPSGRPPSSSPSGSASPSPSPSPSGAAPEPRPTRTSAPTATTPAPGPVVSPLVTAPGPVVPPQDGGLLTGTGGLTGNG
ncbi:lytic transglycosylase domain-containing protein [Streptomyces sp. TRM49041]|uniref:lytic transglycosylase domain-containing protein n=1 Tax=Streptomyces sp. TRM49041 TaxID=2603216 RepID=UPI0021CCC24B|nr:lytic transglycosylase domain-containing protein [Streptomyces sp. TRM49041]